MNVLKAQTGQLAMPPDILLSVCAASCPGVLSAKPNLDIFFFFTASTIQGFSAVSQIIPNLLHASNSAGLAHITLSSWLVPHKIK